MTAKSMMLLFREAKGVNSAAAAAAAGRAPKQMVTNKDDAAPSAGDDRRKKRRTKQVSMSSSWWMPHPRSGIYYPLGHEWVMDDVPERAASSHFTFWLRNSEGVDHPPSNIYDHPSSNATH